MGGPLSHPVHLALCVAFLWALPPLGQKLLLRYFPIRVTMALYALFYLLFVVLFFRNEWSAHGHRDFKTMVQNWPWVLFALLAAFAGGFFPNYLFTRLLESHPTYWVTALCYGSPLFTATLGLLLGGEQPHLRHWLGLFLVTGGIMCLSSTST